MTTQADWLQYVMSGNMVESACRIGAQHAAWAINNAGLGKGGQPAGVNADHKIVGKMGELAAAAFFRRLVTGLNDPKRRDLDDYIEVRSTEKRDWHLILANDPEEKRVDPPDAPYIMCVVEAPVVWFVGWLWGHEGLQPNYLKQMNGRPRYRVPFADLHAIRDAPFLMRRAA